MTDHNNDYDNMIEDAVAGIRDTVEFTVPDDAHDNDCFPPALTIHYRDMQLLVMAFCREEDFQLEVIGYRNGREVIRRVIGMSLHL